MTAIETSELPEDAGWGPTSRRVAANLKRLREARGMSTTRLSKALKDEVGHSVPATGITRIEKGQRRVDSDDLVAFALVFKVSPLTLLFPPTFSDEPAPLTDKARVTSRTAWRWGLGQGPAMDWEPGEGVNLAEPGADPAISATAYEREQEYGREREQYMALALPPELRRAADHPLVRLTQQLEGFVEGIAGSRGDRDDRARWSRMALRRVEQLRLNLEEVTEVLAHGDGNDAQGGTE